MPTPLPLPAWVRLSDGCWHVELVPGATRTRCNKKIPEKARRGTRPVPTHCNDCRNHYQEAKKRVAVPAAPDLVSQVLARLADLQMAVAEARVKHGRDAIRELIWGKVLDALDSGRSSLHADDQLAAIDDELFVRWLMSLPKFRQIRLMAKGARLECCVITITNGVAGVLVNGTSPHGSWDSIAYIGPECNREWLKGLVVRFREVEAGQAWVASLIEERVPAELPAERGQ